MNTEDLLSLVSDIVCAHTSNNAVPADALPELIRSVHGALSSLGQEPAVAAEEERKPAVSVRSSVRPDAIACLECGTRFKMLKRHLVTDHGLTPAEYRARWSLAADYPLVAPNYAAQRKELAVKIGLGRKPKAAAPVVKTPARGKAPAKSTPGRKKLGIASG